MYFKQKCESTEKYIQFKKYLSPIASIANYFAKHFELKKFTFFK